MSGHWTDPFKDFDKHTFSSASDQEIATMVRMLMRSDLMHEAVCVAARDRIAKLSREVAMLRMALQAAALYMEPEKYPVTNRAVMRALALVKPVPAVWPDDLSPPEHEPPHPQDQPL